MSEQVITLYVSVPLSALEKVDLNLLFASSLVKTCPVAGISGEGMKTCRCPVDSFPS